MGFIRLAGALWLLACLPLIGCGFSPLYGTASKPSVETAANFDTISIGGIPDQNGQYLRNALMDRLYQHGRPANARYVLNVKPITETKNNLDITKNESATRRQIRLASSMSLTDLTTGKVVLQRQLITINSFNVLESEYETRVSENYVSQNALDDFARQIETQLALYFKRGAPQPDPLADIRDELPPQDAAMPIQDGLSKTP